MKKHCYSPSLELFRDKARTGNIIPVYTDILADTDTPVSAFMKIDDGGDAFLCESVEGGEKWGRYSLLGTEPRATIRSKGRSVEISTRDGAGNLETIVKEGDPIEILKEYLEGFEVVEVDGLPKFSGGVVGYLGYDIVRHIERLPDLTVDDLDLPEISLIVTDTFMVFDNVEQRIKVISNAFVPEGADPDEIYGESQRKIEALIDKLRSASLPVSFGCQEEASQMADFTSNFEKDDYLSAVRRIKEYIREGDVIQAVLSQRFETDLTAPPFDIYRALRIINPSPYLFFLRLDGVVLAGSSPEILVETGGTRVCVRPIAGTRKRGLNEAEDKALEEELLADPKERAEHIMLVDLGRNDVGRVAETGSVEVDELMIIERYSHVMHIVSNVLGRLREGLGQFDALRACFPAGTLSGAPKVRAMEIIEELEPVKRGVYGGSVGYLGFDGDMDMAITIRTILIKDGRVYVQAGAGIVADSDPESEFEETRSKARGMLKAVEMASKGLG